ncbi:MAG: DUF58 domain-containing protein [Elusimicrobia bacterium]|nr:DUF58 domain-containing protein [Elusimicrobiota bacterium]
MNTAEILKKVRQIEIKTNRIVTETFSGEYLSVFKGRGIEFAEVREYVAGDDVRTIDWNVTAKLSKPFVKLFTEERELTMMILCDVSGSQSFGSSEKFKNEASAELAAMFAFSALKNNDKSGLMLFTDATELYIPPKKGKNHMLRIIRELLAYQPKNRKTDIASALNAINKILKRKSIIILISDFISGGFEQALKRTEKKHDLIPVVIEDRLENELPALNAMINAEYLEDGNKSFTADLSSQDFLDNYSRNAMERKKNLEKTFKSMGIDWINIKTHMDVTEPVVQFFKQRARKIRI